MSAVVLAQFGGDGVFSWIVWIFFMLVFFMFYPRIMTSQIMWKLEKAAKQLEQMSDNSKKFLAKEIGGGKTTPEISNAVDRFFEFFVIEPVSLDPYGIVRKLEHIVQEQKDRFEYFVEQNVPKVDSERKANLMMGLSGGITIHQISKIVRHYVEMVRKTKSIQIAMLLQMQLPMIERLARAVYKGTHALAEGHPIGDAIGPLVVANLMNGKVREIEEDVVAGSTVMKKRKVILLKAKGPGGRLGRPGKAVEKLVKRGKISRIITVDAAAKLEGEKTGSIAEGVGVAMGGPGVERSYIENIAVQKKIPLDSIVIKMAQEEAILPMRKTVKNALPSVMKSIERALDRAKPKSTVLLVGVGNTGGVGNSKKDAAMTVSWVEKYARAQARKKKGKSKDELA